MTIRLSSAAAEQARAATARRAGAARRESMGNPEVAQKRFCRRIISVNSFSRESRLRALSRFILREGR
jgi:hypothetical protein